jgi:hypothetical protein
MGAVMPSLLRKRTDDQILYSIAQLVQLRRQMLRFARSLPPGPERNERRQIASSLRSLFKNKVWLDALTIEGLAVKRKDSGRYYDPHAEFQGRGT